MNTEEYDAAIDKMRINARHQSVGGMRASNMAYIENLDQLYFDFQKEVAEFTEAVADYKRKGTRTNRLHMLSEGVDCQLTMESFISHFEPLVEGREALRKDIVNGNDQVGYYSKKKKCIYRVFINVGEKKVIMTEADSYSEAYEAVKHFVVADKKNDDQKDYYIEEYLINECMQAYNAETGF